MVSCVNMVLSGETAAEYPVSINVAHTLIFGAKLTNLSKCISQNISALVDTATINWLQLGSVNFVLRYACVLHLFFGF